MKHKMKLVRSGLLTLLFNAICIGISVSCIFPLVWLAYSSLKTKGEFIKDTLALPSSPQFENYVKAFQMGDLFTATANSAINVLVNIILVSLVSFLTGYFLSRYSFKGKKIIKNTYLIGFLVPIYALLVPTFVQFKLLGLINTRISIWLPYFAMQVPLAILLMESFMRGLPVEVEEAAAIEGCSLWSTLWRIVFPLCGPILATIAILTSLETWNEFGFSAVMVTEQRLRTVAVAVRSFTAGKAYEYTYMMAALMSASIPIIALYLIFSKQVIKGLTAGAVKG